MISYDRLWIIMKKMGITQYRLIKEFGVSPVWLLTILLLS